MAKKDDALVAHGAAVVAADGALYDAGFTDGVASVPAGIITQADLDALNAKMAALQVEDDARAVVIQHIKDLLA